jgi:lipopolysaccharide transport system permease protein
MFSRSTTISAESILNRAGIVSSIRIPKNIFPISATLTAFYMMCLEFIVLAVFMAGLKFVPPTTIVFFPVLILLLFILCLGISIPLSILNIHYRDVRSIWTIIIQAAFFLTPIFYKLEFLPENIRNIIQFSPLTQIVNMSHQVILENKLPDLYWFLYLVISISAIFLIGMVIYKKYELNVVERL